MRFDPTIDLGSLITAGAFLIGGVAAYARFSARIAVLEARVQDLWENFVHRRRAADGDRVT